MAEKVQKEMNLASDFEEDAGYDPLEFIEGEDDEDWGGDDGALLPEVLPPEESAPRHLAAVYSPERAGSVRQALRNLVTVNASRRTILLSILDWARDGEKAGELFRKIDELQKDNLSVYEPVSYCRMLERAGALTLEMDGFASDDGLAPGSGDVFPEAGEEAAPGSGQSGSEGESSPAGVAYLSIDEDDVEPTWRATEEGLAAYEELIQGDEWRQRVLDEDERYAEVYLAVMKGLEEGGREKADIVALAESFAVTKEGPIRLGTTLSTSWRRRAPSNGVTSSGSSAIWGGV